MTLHREQIELETKFARIAKKAQANPNEVFTSLSHHLSEEFLLSSYRKLRKSAASGLDGKTCHDYELNLLNNIERLHGQLRSWEYKAPDIRRVWIQGRWKEASFGNKYCRR
jgi:retron-type reverse transcriptase